MDRIDLYYYIIGACLVLTPIWLVIRYDKRGIVYSMIFAFLDSIFDFYVRHYCAPSPINGIQVLTGWFFWGLLYSSLIFGIKKLVGIRKSIRRYKAWKRWRYSPEYDDIYDYPE